jgi:hypothetical protein
VCIYYWLNFFFALSWFAVLLFSCLKGDLCDSYDLHDAVLSNVALDRACPVSTGLRGVHCLGHRHAGNLPPRRDHLPPWRDAKKSLRSKQNIISAAFSSVALDRACPVSTGLRGPKRPPRLISTKPCLPFPVRPGIPANQNPLPFSPQKRVSSFPGKNQKCTRGTRTL